MSNVLGPYAFWSPEDVYISPAWDLLRGYLNACFLLDPTVTDKKLEERGITRLNAVDRSELVSALRLIHASMDATPELCGGLINEQRWMVYKFEESDGT